MLTNAQLLAIKADIQADSALNTLWTQQNPGAIAEMYNLMASPEFYVWKTSLTPDDYREAIVWTEVDSLATGKARIWEWLTSNMQLPLNPSKVSVRQGLADTFTAGSTTRTNLLAIAYRPCTKIEKLLSSGTGTVQNPATMTFNGRIEWPQINEAMEAV